MFAPNVPDTSSGTIMLAQRHEVVLVPSPSLSANDLDVSLKKRGVGLSSLTREGSTRAAMV